MIPRDTLSYQFTRIVIFFFNFLNSRVPLLTRFSIGGKLIFVQFAIFGISKLNVDTNLYLLAVYFDLLRTFDTYLKRENR